jgi:hypothetical protein
MEEGKFSIQGAAGLYSTILELLKSTMSIETELTI